LSDTTTTTDNNEDSQSTAIVPIEQRDVDFYGDKITAALVQPSEGSSQVYVPLRPICDYLGLSWTAQLQRTRRNDILKEGILSVFMINTETGQGRGRREFICLSLDLLPGWLFGIDAARVKPELREKIKRYQKDCFRILWQAFQLEALTMSTATASALEVEQPEADWEATSIITTFPTTTTAASPTTTEASSNLIQIRNMALAIAQMAEQQIAFEQQLDETGQLAAQAHERLDRASRAFERISARLRVVEQRTAPHQFINDTQAAQVAQAVKNLAEFLTGQDNSRSRNHYQSVYRTLYQQFGVSSYERIRIGQFEAVMEFLEDWRKAGLQPKIDAPTLATPEQKAEAGEDAPK
jgi:hypothetical protein